MKIHGRTPLTGGAKVSSHGDHRIGMMLGIAACICEQPIDILQPEAVSVSYPSFLNILKSLQKSLKPCAQAFSARKIMKAGRLIIKRMSPA